MGNNEKWKVIGIGDMSVVTNMGHTLTLRNVRHVLNLKLNLMSLRKLADRVASHFDNKVWQIMKGPLVVARENKYCCLNRTVLQSS